MKAYLEYVPKHYVGSYPCVTIHYRSTEKIEALRIKALIESGYLEEDKNVHTKSPNMGRPESQGD